MTHQDKRTLDQALDALERLMRIFQVERIFFLIVTFASFMLFMYAGIRLFTEQEVSVGRMTAILGGTGLATVASMRVSYFLNRSFRIIEDIIRKITETIQQDDRDGKP